MISEEKNKYGIFFSLIAQPKLSQIKLAKTKCTGRLETMNKWKFYSIFFQNKMHVFIFYLSFSIIRLELIIWFLFTVHFCIWFKIQSMYLSVRCSKLEKKIIDTKKNIGIINDISNLPCIHLNCKRKNTFNTINNRMVKRKKGQLLPGYPAVPHFVGPSDTTPAR